MAEITVNLDVLHSAAATEYFTRAEAKVMVGARFVLETLGIQLPEAAKRKPSGRPPSRAVKAAFNADQGVRTAKDYGPKPNESREAYLLNCKVQKAHARAAKRRASNTDNHG